MGVRLGRDFFGRPTLTVARELLGQRLVKLERGGERSSGLIVEAEAYIGPQDLACHAKSGRTLRNAVMWGRPGHAYVYFTYGMHWMLNLVTERDGFPAAVLIRALLPREGLDRIRRRRRNRPELADGPAKLCQALAIDGDWNGHDVAVPDARLFLEREPQAPEPDVCTGPRVGIDSVPEPWKSLPWRFLLRFNGQSSRREDG